MSRHSRESRRGILHRVRRLIYSAQSHQMVSWMTVLDMRPNSLRVSTFFVWVYTVTQQFPPFSRSIDRPWRRWHWHLCCWPRRYYPLYSLPAVPLNRHHCFEKLIVGEHRGLASLIQRLSRRSSRRTLAFQLPTDNQVAVNSYLTPLLTLRDYG